MRSALHMAALVPVALAAFSAGFVLGQESAPTDYKLVSEDVLAAIDLAKEIIGEKGDGFLALPEPEAIARLGAIGLEKMLKAIRTDLAAIGVTFDVWFSERSLYEGLARTVRDRLGRRPTGSRR